MIRPLSVAVLLCLTAAQTPARSHPEFGPYIQAVTESSAVILWEGEDAHQLTLELVGESVPTRFTTQAESTWVDDKWRSRTAITLRGLIPGQRIEGILLDPDGRPIQDGGVDFFAAPRAGPATFLFFGDTGSGSSGQKAIAELMDDVDADFVLHSGDVIYPSGQREGYDEDFFDMYRGLLRRAPFYPCIGNHDIRTEDAAPYLDVFRLPGTDFNRPVDHEGRYYSFRWGDAWVIVLDSNIHGARRDEGCSDGRKVSEKNRYRNVDELNLEERNNPQYRWFVRELARSPEEAWVFVMMHHPPLSTSYHKSHCGLMAMLRDGQKEAGRRVDFVLTGHEHDYQRSWPIRIDDPEDFRNPASRSAESVSAGNDRRFDRDEGTIFVVSGGGGGSQRFRSFPDLDERWIARGEKTYHYTQFFMSLSQVVALAIDKDGEVIDQFRVVR